MVITIPFTSADPLWACVQPLDQTGFAVIIVRAAELCKTPTKQSINNF